MKSTHRVGLFTIILLAGGCMIHSQDPYLPPPPKALSPLSKLTLPDTTGAILAESLLVDSVRIHRGEVKRDGKDGLAPDRFKENPVYASNILTDREDEMLKEREIARLKTTEWNTVGEADYTMILNQPWGRLRTVLRSGDDVTVRGSIWPTDVRVVPLDARIIRFESGWIDLKKISPMELRCRNSTPDAFKTPVVDGGTPGVRMVAEIEAAESRNKVAVTATTELKGVKSCEASSVWQDRVAEFAFDAWMGADRAAKLGGPPLISR